jgi:hypothetical protein
MIKEVAFLSGKLWVHKEGINKYQTRLKTLTNDTHSSLLWLTLSTSSVEYLRLHNYNIPSTKNVRLF